MEKYLHINKNFCRLSSTNSIICYSTIVVLCFTIFVPKLHIGIFGVGTDDFITLFGFPFIISYFFTAPNSVVFRGKSLWLLILWFLLITTGIIFSFFGAAYKLNEFHFPSEMWQYIKRMVFFSVPLYIAFFNKLSSKSFYNILLFTILIALLVGIIQLIPGSLGQIISKIYARAEEKFVVFSNRDFISARNYGVAGFSTAWGGFALFSVCVSMAGLLRNISLYWFVNFFILALAILNLLFSGSRVAIASFFVIYALFIFVGIYIKKNKVLFFFTTTTVLFSSLFSIAYLFPDKIFFIIYRFETMVAESIEGTGRVEQIKTALMLLNTPYDYIFGVGNATQRGLSNVYGTEVEPVYLFVNYGLVGLLLRYGLLFIIFTCSLRQIKSKYEYVKVSAIAAMLSIVGYLIFSLGYFFFQELYVGALPWLLYGWVVGIYFRPKFRTPDIGPLKR